MTKMIDLVCKKTYLVLQGDPAFLQRFRAKFVWLKCCHCVREKMAMSTSYRRDKCHLTEDVTVSMTR